MAFYENTLVARQDLAANELKDLKKNIQILLILLREML